jgi:hypothetical protein
MHDPKGLSKFEKNSVPLNIQEQAKQKRHRDRKQDHSKLEHSGDNMHRKEQRRPNISCVKFGSIVERNKITFDKFWRHRKRTVRPTHSETRGGKKLKQFYSLYRSAIGN